MTILTLHRLVLTKKRIIALHEECIEYIDVNPFKKCLFTLVLMFDKSIAKECYTLIQHLQSSESLIIGHSYGTIHFVCNPQNERTVRSQSTHIINDAFMVFV